MYEFVHSKEFWIENSFEDVNSNCMRPSYPDTKFPRVNAKNIQAVYYEIDSDPAKIGEGPLKIVEFTIKPVDKECFVIWMFDPNRITLIKILVQFWATIKQSCSPEKVEGLASITKLMFCFSLERLIIKQESENANVLSVDHKSENKTFDEFELSKIKLQNPSTHFWFPESLSPIRYIYPQLGNDFWLIWTGVWY